ncbi:conserved hypothetical protein [Talaromyces stipitatus ATCC 10500]|uniref:Rhodopsin domain-containing protein n=1 Tax=Talaromyces stipitatus (strain ATCC 10500 / CBS 375.48 / QM 6759 / NRRL 1006) TaxID=441959 RepID=B8M9X2_TALSN|nr:uncharacterized protein TSTA_118880 [Talaromyces stipitatus ATCC 10500]EED18124.1 conserved hypothetical protein [Talaromyces stipitatus ATCC 10500]
MALPFRQKLILVLTFGVAIFVILLHVIHIVVRERTAISAIKQNTATTIGDIKTGDYTWSSAGSFIWATVEVNTTLVCACVPSLKPLAARFSPSLLRNAREKSQMENGEFKTSPQPSGRENVAGEMMDVITSRPTEGAETAQIPEGESGDSFEEEPPIINVLNKRPASMPKLTKKESFPPNVLISAIFFLWGFSYGLINILDLGFKAEVQQNPWELRGLHAAYYSGYLLGGVLLARLFLKRLGFAGAIIGALYIYACGVLTFWPSAVLASLPTFIVSNIVVGTGLAVLEAAANLFAAICGPLEYSEIRLCITQAIQAIGSVSAKKFAQRVLFKDPNNATDIIRVQWTYLAIAFLTVLLSVLFYYLPLPEAPNDDLRQLAAQRPENTTKLWTMPTCYVTMGIGIWSQLFYVAGQEAHNVNFNDYLVFSRPRSQLTPTDFQSIGNVLFVLGRLLVP